MVVRGEEAPAALALVGGGGGDEPGRGLRVWPAHARYVCAPASTTPRHRPGGDAVDYRCLVGLRGPAAGRAASRRQNAVAASGTQTPDAAHPSQTPDTQDDLLLEKDLFSRRNHRPVYPPLLLPRNQFYLSNTQPFGLVFKLMVNLLLLDEGSAITFMMWVFAIPAFGLYGVLLALLLYPNPKWFIGIVIGFLLSCLLAKFAYDMRTHYLPLKDLYLKTIFILNMMFVPAIIGFFTLVFFPRKLPWK